MADNKIYVVKPICSSYHLINYDFYEHINFGKKLRKILSALFKICKFDFTKLDVDTDINIQDEIQQELMRKLYKRKFITEKKKLLSKFYRTRNEFGRNIYEHALKRAKWNKLKIGKTFILCIDDTRIFCQIRKSARNSRARRIYNIEKKEDIPILVLAYNYARIEFI